MSKNLNKHEKIIQFFKNEKTYKISLFCLAVIIGLEWVLCLIQAGIIYGWTAAWPFAYWFRNVGENEYALKTLSAFWLVVFPALSLIILIIMSISLFLKREHNRISIIYILSKILLLFSLTIFSSCLLYATHFAGWTNEECWKFYIFHVINDGSNGQIAINFQIVYLVSFIVMCVCAITIAIIFFLKNKQKKNNKSK